MQIYKAVNEEKCIFFLTLILVLTGLVYCLSAGSMQALRIGKLEFYFLIKQVIAAIIGFIFIFIAYKIPLDVYRRLIFIIYLLTIGLLLIVFLFDEVNGAHRWINFPYFSLQPSEFAKFTLVLYLAHYLDKKNDRLRDFLGGFLPACVLVGIIAGLVVLEPDFGGAFLIILIGFSLFFIAGVNIKHIVGISLFSLPAIVSFLLVDYRRDRLIGFLDPWRYQETTGYQLIQSLIAVGSGGIFGKGLGNSTQKLYFLPEIHTDFIYAGIAEELGFIGSIFILILFVILFIFCIDSTLKQKDNFRFLLTFGCTLLVILPALFHILAVLGLVPTKGLTLPFVSYGGSSLIMNMFIIGVILRGLKENRCV